MTLNYGIFDSADPASPDRTYTATLLSRILSKYLSNGVVSGDLNELKVSVTDPPAMKVIVATGTAIVQGRFCENDAALTLSVTTAHSTYPRIDRVVVRLSAVSGRSVDVVVVAGTPAASPVSPTLTQTSETWEIPLARIAVGAGVTSILTANITDERVFPDMTNLFKAAVTMMSNLTVGGDLDVGGNISVDGSLSVVGNLEIDVTGDVTGNLYGYLVRDITFSTADTGVTLIPAVTEKATASYSVGRKMLYNTVYINDSLNTGAITIAASGGTWGGDDNWYAHVTNIICYGASGSILLSDSVSGTPYAAPVTKNITIPVGTVNIVLSTHGGGGTGGWTAVYADINDP